MDFFVLPVSVHEILLIEKRPQIGQEHLFSMMQAINSDTALSENMLSERIFTIDRNEKTLRYITDGKEVEVACQFCDKVYTFSPDEVSSWTHQD